MASNTLLASVLMDDTSHARPFPDTREIGIQRLKNSMDPQVSYLKIRMRFSKFLQEEIERDVCMSQLASTRIVLPDAYTIPSVMKRKRVVSCVSNASSRLRRGGP
jgi:hypothetical protein